MAVEIAANAWLTEEGEPDFELLFRRAKPQLLAVARRLMHDEDDAEDVVQQAFINGLRHRQRFEARAQATSWMYRIVYNTALMALRSKRRKRADSLDALPAEFAEAQVHQQREHTPEAIDPERALERARLGNLLKGAMKGLTPLDKQIVELRLKEGYSTHEVAELVGLSAAATKTRLHRARQRLATELAVAS